MKLTSVSSRSMNRENATDTTDVPAPTAIPPRAAKMNISNVNTITIMCPPIMLANRRTISAAGFVKIPNTSIIGMIGIGNLSHSGTSGQKMSF